MPGNVNKTRRRRPMTDDVMLIDGCCDGLIDTDDGRIGDMDRHLVLFMVGSGHHGQSRLALPKVPPRPLVMSDKP